jgi:hypothetical protein
MRPEWSIGWAFGKEWLLVSVSFWRLFEAMITQSSPIRACVDAHSQKRLE